MIGINIIIKFCTEAKPELIKQIIDSHTLTHFLYKKKTFLSCEYELWVTEPNLTIFLILQ